MGETGGRDLGDGVVGRLAGEVAALVPDDPTAQSIPLPVIIALIQSLTLLLQACYPQPAMGAAALVEPPKWRPFSRARWQSWVSAHVADQWPGDVSHVRGVQLAVLKRLRAGLDIPDVEGLYAEAGV